MMNQLKKNIHKLLCIGLMGIAGCGSSSEDFELNLDAAYTTILEAHVEQQIALYDIIKLLSNDYTTGLLLELPNDTQLAQIEERLHQLALLTDDVLAVQQELTDAGTTIGQLWGVDGVENSTVEFFSLLRFFLENRRNEFLLVMSMLSQSEQIALFDGLPDELKMLAMDPFDFYRKVEQGQLDDVLSAIIANAEGNAGYATVAAQLNVTRVNVIVTISLRLIYVSAKVMVSVNQDVDGTLGRMSNGLVNSVLLETLLQRYSEFVTYRSVAFYEGSIYDSLLTSITPFEILAGIIVQNVGNVRTVEDLNLGDVVTGDADAFIINPAGKYEESLGAIETIATNASISMAMVFDFPTIVPSVATFRGEWGYLALFMDDGTSLLGFTAAEQLTMLDGLPEWIIGLGNGGSDEVPVWLGALPVGQWRVTAVATNGVESSSGDGSVTDGGVATVLVVPPKKKKKKATKDSWFDWVEYVDADGGGLPFGDGDNDGDAQEYNASCDERAIDNGTCTDYLGLTQTTYNNIQGGCAGTFGGNVLCDAVGVTYSCYMEVNAPGDPYVLRFHVYNADATPLDARQRMCDQYCQAFSYGDITVNNCTLE